MAKSSYAAARHDATRTTGLAGAVVSIWSFIALNDPLPSQLADLRRAVAQHFGENLVGVLAEQRRGTANGRRCFGILDRDSTEAQRANGRVGDFGDHAPVQDLWIGEQGLHVVDRPAGDGRLDAELHPLVAGPGGHHLGDQR